MNFSGAPILLGRAHSCLTALSQGAFTIEGGRRQCRRPPRLLPLAVNAALSHSLRLQAYNAHNVRIAIGADHVGFALKAEIADWLKQEGYEVLDLGTFGEARVDYPDFAQAVGSAIQRGLADRGILLCGSGVGMCIAANKMNGIRASVCHDTYSAHQGVEHDDMNVLVLGARIVGSALAEEIIRAFLSARFNGEARYVARLRKIERLESEQGRSL